MQTTKQALGGGGAKSQVIYGGVADVPRIACQATRRAIRPSLGCNHCGCRGSKLHAARVRSSRHTGTDGSSNSGSGDFCRDFRSDLDRERRATAFAAWSRARVANTWQTSRSRSAACGSTEESEGLRQRRRATSAERSC